MRLNEIEEVLQISKAFELNPNAKYFLITEPIPVTKVDEIQKWLKAQGMDVIVFPMDCRLLEIER